MCTFPSSPAAPMPPAPRPRDLVEYCPFSKAIVEANLAQLGRLLSDRQLPGFTRSLKGR